VNVKGSELASEIVGVVNDFLNKGLQPLRIGSTRMLLGGQTLFDTFGHQGDTGQFLAEIIVQVKAYATPFVLGDFEEFVFEPFALLNDISQFEICRLQIRRGSPPTAALGSARCSPDGHLHACSAGF